MKYALREVADLTFYDLVTNKPFLYMDYALTSNNEHSADTTYARGGKGNFKQVAFDGNKESMLTVSTQVIDFRMISLLAGATVTTGATNVFKREVLTAVDNTGTIEITLSETPVEDTVFVFPLDEDAITGSEETISETGTTVAITGGVAGDEYVAYYQFESAATAEKIEFKIDGFPKTCKIVGDTLIKNKSTGVNEAFQMVAYKAKPMANFTLTMASEGDPTSIEMTFDLLAGENGNYIDYIKY